MAEANKKEYIGSVDFLLICQLIYKELEKYQKAIDGKSLSQEDFTTALKTKLEGIAEGAEVNVQSDWSVTDTSSDAFIKNKPDLEATYAKLAGATFTGAVKVPTAGSDADDKTAVNIAYLNSAIAAITGIKFDADESGEGYASLTDLQTKHATGAAGTIYLVKNSGTGTNKFDEYFWNESSKSYEKFGSTDADLSQYLLKTDVIEMSKSDVQTIWDSVFGTTSSGS